MNSFLPPTITPVEDEPTIQAPIMESVPTITPVEDEVQYIQQPQQIQYVEEPQIQYVEQPQIEYVEQPQIEYVQEQPQVQYVEVPQQPVVVPIATPPPPPPPQQDDLSKYYAILDQFGAVEPDDECPELSDDQISDILEKAKAKRRLKVDHV